VSSPGEARGAESTRIAADPVSHVRATERDAFLALAPEEMADSARRGALASSRLVDRVRLLITLGRPRTCVPGLLAYALGFSYTAAAPSWRVALGALLAFPIGFLANLHNTATDLSEDSHNLPGRVFLVAQLGYTRLLRFCTVLGAAMLAGAITLGAHFAIFMAIAVAGLHQYSAPPVRSKGRPLLGLWVFAQAVVFPFLFGWTTAPGTMLSTLLRAIAAPLLGNAPAPEAALRSYRYLAMWFFLTLWFMAKGTVKNLPDFEGDRAAGVRTSATVFASRREAALASMSATVVVYALLPVLVLLGLEAPRVAFAALWLAPAAFNSARLVRAGREEANQILKVDMLISSGFIATLLLLVAPSSISVAFVVAGALALFGSDLLGLDSRRATDVRSSRGSTNGAVPADGVVRMELRASASIPFEATTVFAAFRDDVCVLRKYMPHARSIDVLTRTERGDLVDTVVAWRVGARVPAFVRALARDAFEWTDYATWDASTLSVEWQSDGGAIRCKARDVFVSRGTDLTELVLVGTVAVDARALPVLFGPVRPALARRIARYVADDMPRSVQRVAAAFAEHLRARPQ
jgi:4-hydroxybenzoate polyprenyltransferase